MFSRSLCILQAMMTILIEKAQQNGSTHSCNYCDRVFNSRKALGGHLRAHKNIIWKYPNNRGLNTSIDGNRRENGNEFIMPSNLSDASNCNASSRALALSGRLVPCAFPLGPPMYLGPPNNPLGLAPYGGSTGFCHFNAEGLQSFMCRFPHLSRNLLQIMKYHNHNSHSYSASVICPACSMMNSFSEFKGFNPHPGRDDVNKVLDTKNPGSAGLLPPQQAPQQAMSGGSSYRNDNIRGITSGRVTKPAVKVRAPRRPTLRSRSLVGWERDLPCHELLLFKDAEESSSTTDEEEEDEANMDLSLHL